MIGDHPFRPELFDHLFPAQDRKKREIIERKVSAAKHLRNILRPAVSEDRCREPIHGELISVIYNVPELLSLVGEPHAFQLDPPDFVR